MVKGEFVSPIKNRKQARRCSDCLVDRRELGLDGVLKRWPLDELHHQVEFNVLVLPRLLIGLDDSWNAVPIKNAKAANLDQEPISPLPLFSGLTMQLLERSHAPVLPMDNLPNNALAAATFAGLRYFPILKRHVENPRR